MQLTSLSAQATMEKTYLILTSVRTVSKTKHNTMTTRTEMNFKPQNLSIICG